MYEKNFVYFFLFTISLSLPQATHAQGFESREVQGEIIRIESFQNGDHPAYTFTAKTEEGEEFTINTFDSYPEGYFVTLREGQKVVLQIFQDSEGKEKAALADLVRTPAITWIFIFFALVTISVGLLRGVNALFGLALSIGILFFYIFPQILAGADPVMTTVIGSIFLLAINMHLSHGFNKKTAVAFLGTVIGLILVVFFAHAFVSLAKLSGLGSEEAMFLYLGVETITVPAGILLAGIILGAVGVLDDIAIAQSEVVTELKEANPALDRKELFLRAMRVGRHHIASTVNTLVLAYVGAALPLFLLFLHSSVSIESFINIELVAEEIIRTLAGTTALVLTVPISTWLSVLVQQTKHR